METDALLEIARETIDRVPMCMAITVGADGDANARVVQPSRLTAAWSVRFMSDRRTRKIEDIERSGRITLAYQHDAGGAYVALVGRATIIDDVAVKKRSGSPRVSGGIRADQPIPMWCWSRLLPSASKSGAARMA